MLGIDGLKAAEIAVEEINAQGGIRGRTVELLVEDDRYDTARAVTAYNRLVSRGASVIFASTYGGIFATADRARKDGVIVINPLDCNNDIAALPENTFCIATESESIGRIISQDMAGKQFHPIAVLYDEKNPFMVLVQNVIRERFGHLSTNLFAGLDQSSADFKAVLARVKASRAKALVLLGHDPMGQAMREARSMGIRAQFYTVGTITSPVFQKLAGPAAEGSLVAYWEAPRSAAFSEFLARFAAKTQRTPILELATVPTYDAVRVVFRALDGAAAAADGRITADAIAGELLKVKDYSGLAGSIAFDPDGAVRSIRESLFRFESGKLIRTETREK